MTMQMTVVTLGVFLACHVALAQSAEAQPGKPQAPTSPGAKPEIPVTDYFDLGMALAFEYGIAPATGPLSNPDDAGFAYDARKILEHRIGLRPWLGELAGRAVPETERSATCQELAKRLQHAAIKVRPASGGRCPIAVSVVDLEKTVIRPSFLLGLQFGVALLFAEVRNDPKYSDSSFAKQFLNVQWPLVLAEILRLREIEKSPLAQMLDPKLPDTLHFESHLGLMIGHVRNHLYGWEPPELMP